MSAAGAATFTSYIVVPTIMATSTLKPNVNDAVALGTSDSNFSDIFLADGAVVNFGNDQDVTLTHVADTGLLLSGTSQLQFNDSGTYINSNADGDLDLVSDGTANESIKLTSAGGITLDAGTDIIIDADESTVYFKDAGTVYARLSSDQGFTVNGALAASGSVTLGDAAADVITVTGQLTASEGLTSTGRRVDPRS